MVPGVRQPAGLADRHRADDVDEDEQDSQHRDDGPAYDQDPANVADHIAVLLGSPRCQQALAAGAAGPCDFRGSTSVARSWAMICDSSSAARASSAADRLPAA